mmetsp:Transcript_17013/g.22171  ORF Transcript_17013/g.22171 Transcript_17013/m.22171 type:complete len:227 (-) Transcript_17013:202-882(-)
MKSTMENLRENQRARQRRRDGQMVHLRSLQQGMATVRKSYDAMQSRMSEMKNELQQVCEIVEKAKSANVEKVPCNEYSSKQSNSSSPAFSDTFSEDERCKSIEDPPRRVSVSPGGNNSTIIRTIANPQPKEEGMSAFFFRSQAAEKSHDIVNLSGWEIATAASDISHIHDDEIASVASLNVSQISSGENCLPGIDSAHSKKRKCTFKSTPTKKWRRMHCDHRLQSV